MRNEHNFSKHAISLTSSLHTFNQPFEADVSQGSGSMTDEANDYRIINRFPNFNGGGGGRHYRTNSLRAAVG